MKEKFNKYVYDLPIMPEVAANLLNMPENISSSEIEGIIKVDPILTARILRTANASIYSRVREISSIKDAVTLLGIKKIKSLTILIVGSELFKDKKEDFYKEFWLTSLNTAFLAKHIAEDTGKISIAEDIFTTGTLHNIGQGILYNYDKETYISILKNSDSTSLKEQEEKSFGVSSNEVGYNILNNWDFPRVLTESIKNCLNPSSQIPFQGVVNTVSAAKLIVQKSKKQLQAGDNQRLNYFREQLNIRDSRLHYYIHDFPLELENSMHYKICLKTLSLTS